MRLFNNLLMPKSNNWDLTYLVYKLWQKYIFQAYNLMQIPNDTQRQMFIIRPVEKCSSDS
jgi:hypothetical protein